MAGPAVATLAEPVDTLPISESRPNGSSTPQKSSGVWQKTAKHLRTEITLDHADIPVLATCLVAGLCDSGSYNAWNCFVSMQTGNTIFLALGASGQPATRPYGWLKSLTSIFFFYCGCFFFSSTRHINPKSRGTLAISFFLQAICIVIAAILIQTHVVPEPMGLMTRNDVDFMELLPLGFLAFQSGGQITTSRLLGFNEIPTTVLTSVYCDVASDPKILAKHNVKRNRRVGAIISILLGGIAGGWISRSSAGLSVVFWLAAAIKFGISIGWASWKPRSVL